MFPDEDVASVLLLDGWHEVVTGTFDSSVKGSVTFDEHVQSRANYVATVHASSPAVLAVRTAPRPA